MNVLYGPSWSFTVQGIATKRGADKGRGGHLHADPDTVRYEQRVASAALEAGLAVGEGPCEVRLAIYPPDWRRRDHDRVLCAIFDGMKRAGKRALADDNMRVVRRTVIETPDVDAANPRVEVTVTLLDVACPRAHAPQVEPYVCACGEVVA